MTAPSSSETTSTEARAPANGAWESRASKALRSACRSEDAARVVEVGSAHTRSAQTRMGCLSRDRGTSLRRACPPDDLYQPAAPGPLLIAIDQEGGRVQRLRPPHWTELPSARRLGELDAAGGAAGMNGTAIAEKVGLLIAEELSACGIDQDYAPVLDVDTNPDNPVIGDRSFGRVPARVARLGTALGQGLEAGRVASCGKHFPGHGDTSQDSHLTLPRLAHDRERLWQVELVPFVAAARAGLASVMTAHIRFEAFDRLPATLSREAMKLLRKDVEFQGACISDDLEMKAIADTYGVVDGAELAIAAGVDAVLVCHTLTLQHDAIARIARSANAGSLAR